MNGGDTAECSGTSQITPEFLKSLETQLKIRKSVLEDSIKEHETSNSTMTKEMRLKCSKLKSMKKEVSDSKSRIEGLRRTLHDLKQSNKDLSEHTLMLKADVEAYDRESIAIAKEEKKCLEKADAKWKIYKEKYEQLPLAVRLRKEEVELKKAIIESMIKRYKLTEKKRMIAEREAIKIKRRNCLAIECAKIWSECRSEEAKIREAFETRKKLRMEIRRQETTINDLTEERRRERLKAEEKYSSMKTEAKIIASNFTTPKFQRLAIPRKGMPQPIPNWWKNNCDNISICSTLIDELIEPTSELRVTESDKRTAESNEAVNRFEDSVNVGEKMQVNDDEKSESDEQRVDRSTEEEKEESLKTEESKVEKGDGRSQELNYRKYGKNFGHRGTENYREGAAKDLEEKNLPPEEKIEEKTKSNQPMIRSIETVEFNLPLKTTTTTAAIAKPTEPESLSRYFSQGESSSDFNWKRGNNPESLYTLGDSRRDGQVDSILGSQVSLRSEEMMKRFRLALDSSELGIDKDEELILPDENDRDVTSQGTANAFSSIRSPTASPFVGIPNFEPTNANRDREKRFFLNMF